jgi:hypothetical protein
VALEAEPDDDRGRAKLVLAAADLVQGECSRYLELRSSWKRGDMDQQMQQLLQRGGQPRLAGLIAHGAACVEPAQEPAP